MFLNNQLDEENYNLEERKKLRSYLTWNKDKIYLDKTYFICVKLVQGRLEIKVILSNR